MKNKEQHTFPFIEHLLDGAKVEWKKLGDVCEIKTGQTVSKNIIAENEGEFPVINSGREPLGFINTWNTDNDPIGVTSRGAGVGSITWQEGKYFRGNLNYSVSINNFSILNTKFLYYLLLQMQVDIQALCTYQGIPALNAVNFKKLLIPIPPLSVQERIVEILDKFTTLEAELEAELDCRKRQYEFYRNQLLTFDILNKECVKVGKRKVMPLGEIVTIKNGKSYKHLSMGNIPVYGSGGIMCFVDEYVYNKPSVLIPRKGSLENIFYIEEPFWNVDTIFYTEINDKIIMPKFLYYYLLNQHLENLNLAGGVPSLTQKVLNKILIPIPPLAEQHRIVSILDKFDTLTTSISEGLPKEIELRRKQYEYYRERLLSFKH